MKRLLLFLLCLVSATSAQMPKASPSPQETPPPPLPLDSLLITPSVWEMSSSQFGDNIAMGFQWVSVAHDAVQNTRKNILLFGQPVCQVLVNFDHEKPKEISALFYNRGDMGSIDRPHYENLIKSLISTISTATKTAYVARGKDAANAVKVDGVIWNTPSASLLLEYSCTKTPQMPFRAEFVRLRITPPEKPKTVLDQPFSSSEKPTFVGVNHITRNAASGDVFIKDIPMVDQGQKGYCVVATVERVLRYYGVKVDENELAQIANSDASKGTSMLAMTQSLKKLTARFRIRVRMLYELDLRVLIADYNVVAKRAKENPINSGVVSDPDQVYAYEIFAQINPDILRESRAKNRTARSAFIRQVKTHVDTGIPVLWGVISGVMPEQFKAPKPSSHMRLIIGYNEKTDEILYSDSWGIGHELKRMPTADAWAMTIDMSTVEPL